MSKIFCDYETSQSQLINSVISNISDFERQETFLQDSKANFNPFNCLTKHHLEELHTKFIHYLLEPTRDHHCGTAFLRTFLDVIAENVSGLSQLSAVHLDCDLINARVEREKFIGWSEETDSYGRIDIVINTKKYIIAIENKINSGEGINQLNRYISYCSECSKREGKNFTVLYLTPFAAESDQAIEGYSSISYKDDITKWISRSIENMSRFHNVTSGLNYYLSTLTSNILKSNYNNTQKKMRDFLLKEENRHLLKELDTVKLAQMSSAVTAIRNEIRNDFFKAVSKSFARRGLPIEPSIFESPLTEITASQIWDKQYRGFKLNDPVYTFSKDGYSLFLLIEHNWESLYYGLSIFNSNHQRVKQELVVTLPWVKLLVDRMSKITNYTTEVPEDEWLVWKYFQFDENDTSIGSDRLNFSMLEDCNKYVEKLEKEVSSFLDLWRTEILSMNQ